MMIGKIGDLLEISSVKCELSSSYAARSSFSQTLGGRVIEQRGPLSRREWSVGVNLHDYTTLAQLEALYFSGVSPLYFLPADALAVNMLTPRVSLLNLGSFQAPASEAGPRRATDGFRSPSSLSVPPGAGVFIGDSQDGLLWGAPVVPGRSYRIAAYVSGIGATLTAVYRDAGQFTIGSTSISSGDEYFTRRSFVSVAPEGAVEVLLKVTGGSGFTRLGAPSVSEGQALKGWGVGKSCRKASIDNLSMSPDLLGREALGSQSFTIREVG